MTEYLKLRSGRRIVLVRVIRPGIGKRVTREGEDWYREDAKTFTEELIVYGQKNVICKMQMNLHYGELEPA